MQSSIAIEVLASVSENGFSLDELVYRTRELFEKEGLAGFVGLILMMVDEKLSLDLTRGRSAWRPRPCCHTPHYEVQDRIKRRFRTSVGTVQIRWRRIRCRHCGKSRPVLREFLGLNLHQSKSCELERIVAEVVSEQSYRRTSRHLGLIGDIPVPKSTAHRWVMDSDCDRLEDPEAKLKLLLADGTGYKRRPDRQADLTNEGDLRIALGVTYSGKVLPLGTWSGWSWQEIGRQLGDSLGQGQRLASLFISDGEPGLPQGLVDLADGHQRCHWHAVHDLDARMRRDGAPIKLRRKLQKELAGIIAIPLSAEDHEKVRAEDKQVLRREVDEAEAKVDHLVKRLVVKGYSEAARYIARARNRLFSYVRFWLEQGVVCPRACSLIERMMREIARRLKRIAFGWSQRGAAKMARIILKRITTAGQWERYWCDRLRIVGDVMLILRGIRPLPSPQLLGQ